ncbi:MAG: hypothetical protein KF745_15415 [Phycisphaeraceae bacterium]|nr:hypothetical protein [Phycisphaeraceae bacterium]
MIGRLVQALMLGGVVTLGACQADTPRNPSFPLTVSDANRSLREMAEQPKSPPRPVVVIGGIYDPGWVAANCRKRLEAELTPGTPIVSTGQLGSWTIDGYRDRIIDLVETSFPSDTPGQTIEVDVVAFSLGGLAARYSAIPRDDGGKRLRIARLFTIASPHRGADLVSRIPRVDPIADDVKEGSEFHRLLDEALPNAEYELFAYVRLGDEVVGEANAAPAGAGVWWVPNQPMQMSHMDAYKDPRILADIARRLRGEEPFALSPPAPLPPESRRASETEEAATSSSTSSPPL